LNESLTARANVILAATLKDLQARDLDLFSGFIFAGHADIPHGADLSTPSEA
jgi:hypothetical protein